MVQPLWSSAARTKRRSQPRFARERPAPANVAISNDSGLLHVAAALGTPTIGIFGPTSPWHWAPLNPLAGVVQADGELDCRPCHKPVCGLGHHRCMREIPPAQIMAIAQKAFAAAPVA